MGRLSNQIVATAISEARKSPHVHSHHGAVLLLKDGHVLRGYNHGLTHAEKHVVIKAGSRAYDAELVVVRIRADNSLTNSKPCVNCMKLIKKYSLSTWYSNGEGIVVKL